MSKDHLHRRDLMREQLAYDAARLMAEGGITDYAFAKRKAAKQKGIADTQHLPSNNEIEMALRSFRALYQSESYPLVLYQLRQQAFATMHLLKQFHPFLTGSVLDGTAGEQSDINLLIFSDDEKALMMFLLNHNLSFEGGVWDAHLTVKQKDVPSFMIRTETGVPVHIAVLPESARHSGSYRTGKYADMGAVKQLLEAHLEGG